MTNFKINGKPVDVDANPNTPLLWVIREHLKLTDTKFGCALGQCGSCTVHVNGEATFSCLTPVSAVEDRDITTIEGLSEDASHPLQKAWIEEEVPQRGYCQSSQIMNAATLLNKNPNPSLEEIIEHMNSNLCRCGTYKRIIKAIQHAAQEV